MVTSVRSAFSRSFAHLYFNNLMSPCGSTDLAVVTLRLRARQASVKTSNNVVFIHSWVSTASIVCCIICRIVSFSSAASETQTFWMLYMLFLNIYVTLVTARFSSSKILMLGHILDFTNTRFETLYYTVKYRETYQRHSLNLITVNLKHFHF